MDCRDVRDRKVKGQQAYIRYHTGTRWSPHHELSYQTGEVEEWGACNHPFGSIDIVAGLPTWTLVYRMEKGWEASTEAVGFKPALAGPPTCS